MDYPKLISEKWNLTAKFNCLQAIYFYAPSALAVPMCGSRHRINVCPTIELSNLTQIHLKLYPHCRKNAADSDAVLTITFAV